MAGFPAVARDRIEWVTDGERFAALRDAWEALAAPEPTPFGSHAWFDCWWQAFGAGQDLSICTAWRGHALVAVLPLCRRRERLASMANDHTPLFRAPARDRQALIAVVEAAHAAEPEAFALHAVRVQDPLLEVARAAGRRRHRPAIIERVHASPIIDTSGDRTAYFRSRASRMRTQRNKLHREHDARFVLEDCRHDLDAQLDTAFAVEASGWKGRAGTAIRSTPETELFYRAVAHAHRERGELRVAWLYLDGRPAAMDLLLLRARRMYLLKTGLDETFQSLSAGGVLHLELIERCFDLELEACELLGGEEPWKLRLATGRREHARLLSYSPRPLGLARYAGRRAAVPLLRKARDGISAWRR
jgi:CelD/BcsL family acetyltransferase involved in cellulose biosynthesis